MSLDTLPGQLKGGATPGRSPRVKKSLDLLEHQTRDLEPNPPDRGLQGELQPQFPTFNLPFQMRRLEESNQCF